LKEISVRNLLK